MKNSLKPYAVGTKIQWKWLGRYIQGAIREIHLQPMAKVIKEKNIKRNGSKENPAYLVESSAGNLALKLHTELELAPTDQAKSKRPQLFR